MRVSPLFVYGFEESHVEIYARLAWIDCRVAGMYGVSYLSMRGLVAKWGWHSEARCGSFGRIMNHSRVMKLDEFVMVIPFVVSVDLVDAIGLSFGNLPSWRESRSGDSKCRAEEEYYLPVFHVVGRSCFILGGCLNEFVS